MPDRCVVINCSSINDPANGISLHRIPFWDERPEARKRQWIAFVSRKRSKWHPSKSSVVCSKHFRPDDFVRKFTGFAEKELKYEARLKRDYIGISAIPSVYPVNEQMSEQPMSNRERRRTLKETINKPIQNLSISSEDLVSGSLKDEEPEQEPLVKDASTETSGCIGCKNLNTHKRQMRNRWLSTKEKLKKCRAQLRKLSDRGKKPKSFKPSSPDATEKDKINLDQSLSTAGFYKPCDYSESESDTLSEKDSDDEHYVEEAEFIDETSTEDSEDEDLPTQNSRVTVKDQQDQDIRTEPKYIVFFSQLLLLFHLCPACKSENPLVETRQVGTLVEVKTICGNNNCSEKENIWYSQPHIPGSRIPACNLLVSFGILLSGCSPSKVLNLFTHIGLAGISLRRYFKFQSDILYPAISIHWTTYQEKMLTQLKSLNLGLTVSGDGRHDSMGHSAKYCAYTIFSGDNTKIIHFSLVQKNETSSSTAMEYMAFQRCFTFLHNNGLPISTFISDRHSSIAKHMKEKLPNTKHYFDLWHLAKKIRKVLTKTAKVNGCEALTDWIKPCERHLYWSATSTINGDGNVMWAKFKSFLSHIINMHSNLDEPLFNKCAHDTDITQRKWLIKESLVYEKVYGALTNKRLVNGIRKASPKEQTSCIEGFHSTLNQFSPKMVAYSYVGMFCRHIIAVLHFNYNLDRKTITESSGQNRLKVTYPKFKNGQATVREVRVRQDFAYVDEIFKTMITMDKKTLNTAKATLIAMTPSPMNSVLEKQPKQDAIKIHLERKQMKAINVPPTTSTAPVSNVQVNPRKTRCCRVCKNPMKGHKNVTNCPKNARQNDGE